MAVCDESENDLVMVGVDCVMGMFIQQKNVGKKEREGGEREYSGYISSSFSELRDVRRTRSGSDSGSKSESDTGIKSQNKTQTVRSRPAGQTEVMAVVLLLLVLSCGALSSSEAQMDFSTLPESHRKGVELAVKQINSHPTIQQHFLFFKSLDKSDIDGGFGVKFLYHRFLLKATVCRRGVADAKCAFRNDRPLIDCGICYKTFNGEIEETPKPYIHCVHKPTLTKDMVSTRMDICNKMSYSSGSASVLLVTGTNN